MGAVQLSFVMPAYNEEESIEDSLYSLERVVRSSNLQYEIVVVNDGSIDATGTRAVRYANRNGHVRVVNYSRNAGKGFAVKTGFQRSSGDMIVFVDSDLEIGFEQILRCVDALQYGDIAIASKNHPESVVDVPLPRRILSNGFNLLTRWLTGINLKDTQTGLKAMRRSALETVFPHMTVKRFAFDVELLAVANLHGLRIVEIPVNLRIRGAFQLREVFKMFIDLLGIAYRLRITHTYRPVQPLPEAAGRICPWPNQSNLNIARDA